MEKKQAVVIGAGIGGLAAAIRLAVKGYQVTLLESNPYTGGKLTEIKSNGYRFDAGPSLFTMPTLVDELFTLAGKDPKSYFEYDQLDEVCRYFYPDGTLLKAHADPQLFAHEASQKTGIESSRVLRHLKKSSFIYEATAYLFLERSLHKVSSYLSFRVLISILKLPFLHLYTSMNALNRKVLRNDKMVQLFNRYATYNGSNPYKAPGILHIIPHLEFNQGAFFPKGGMHSISQSIYRLALDLGVEVKLNTKAQKILVQNKRAIGVQTAQNTYLANQIVCNMDVVPAYKHLLSEQKQPTKILKQERSTSALIFYWGVKQSFPNLILHNILFSEDYQHEFDVLSQKKTISNDPTVYINITSKHQTSDAPEGSENWFVMVNVPHNEGQDWDNLIQTARKNIISKINKQLGTDLEQYIQTEEILDPRSIESNTQSYQGALYGTASNEQMAAFFRHPNFSSELKNLYFCGGSVHPGGGIPLALCSAKIVDSLIPSAQ